MLMKCVKCSKEDKILELGACSRCFAEIVEKRVRKEVRQNSLLEKGDNLILVDDASAQAIVSSYLIENAFSLPLTIKKANSKFKIGKEFKGRKVIIPWDADMEGEYLLSCVFENKKPRYLGHYVKGTFYIKLLLPLTSREVIAYARLKNLKFSEKKGSAISELLNRLEDEYPETKFSLLKSSKELKKDL
jgi:hypothetical protein